MERIRGFAAALSMVALLAMGAAPAAAQGAGGDQYCEEVAANPSADCDSTVVIILPPLPEQPADEQYGDDGQTPGGVPNPLPGEAPDGTISVELPSGTVASFDEEDIIGLTNDGRGVILPAVAVTYAPAQQPRPNILPDT